MSGTTAKELKIPPSQELAVEAIRTLPLNPVFGSVYFVADGINETYQEQEIEQYLQDCAEKGIIPYSRVKMEYSADNQTFVPHEWGDRLGSGFGGFSNKYGQANQKAHAVCLSTVRGGRINKIAFDIANMPREAFDALRGTFLDAMLKEKYEINQANIVLSTWHSNAHYAEGDYPDTEICFYNSVGMVSGLELRLGHEISLDDRTEIGIWFNKLDKKYGKK